MPSRSPYYPIAVWLVLLITAALSLRGTAVSHDLTQFLPDGATKRQQLAVDLLREGPTTRLIMMSLEDAKIEQLAETSRRLASLLSGNDLFSQVANGDSGIPKGQLDTLFNYRYLLDPGLEENSFTDTALRRKLLMRLDELSGVLSLHDRQHLASDPTGAFRNLLESWIPVHQPELEQGVWCSPDRERALLVAVTAGSGFDSMLQQQAIAAIHAAFKEARTAPEIQLQLSGAPVFADAARNSIRTQITRLSTLAGVLVALFLLAAYRSPLLMLLGALPLFTAMLAGAAAVALLFGGLHGITLVFGITLLGVAIDYPIHLFSHLAAAPDSCSAIRRIWPTLRLGVITTCLGYLAFARTDFTGLAQLGVFTTAGLVAAAAVTRWVLPALIPQHTQAQPGALFKKIEAQMLEMSPRLAGMIGLLAVLAIPVLLLLFPPQWETDLQKLSPLSAEQRQLANELRKQLGGAEVSQLIVVQGDDPDQVLRRSEKLAGQLSSYVALGLINDFDMAARYLPSVATQKQRQAVLPDSIVLEQQLRQAMQGLPFKDDAFAPFLDDVDASRVLPVLDLDAALETPVAARIQPLLYHNDQRWYGLVTLSGMGSSDDFEHRWQQHRTTGSDYLDLKRASADLLTGFRASTLDRLLLGMMAIVLVVSLGLRSLPDALKTLLPVFLATGLTIALLGSMGERLSLFHLVAVLLTAGIGIDYSLFFQRRELEPGQRQATLHALTVCAVSTFAVFAVLSSSPIPVLRAIGLTVAIGVPLCFTLALGSSRLIGQQD